MSDAVACKSCWIAGSATLTMVPSMNAMLEPMMVAIRTQRLLAAGSGAGAPWRMIASSQGGLPICTMVCGSLPRSAYAICKTPLALEARACNSAAASYAVVTCAGTSGRIPNRKPSAQHDGVGPDCNRNRSQARTFARTIEAQSVDDAVHRAMMRAHQHFAVDDME